MTSSDIANMTLVGLIGGVLAFVVLHWNLTPGSRARAVRWCLWFGGVSVAFFVAHWLFGFGPMSAKALLAFGFVGLPAFVVGVLLVIVGMFKARREHNARGA